MGRGTDSEATTNSNIHSASKLSPFRTLGSRCQLERYATYTDKPDGHGGRNVEISNRDT